MKMAAAPSFTSIRVHPWLRNVSTSASFALEARSKRGFGLC